MTDHEFRITLGSILIVAGIIWVWVGDKKIPVKGGVVLRLFSHPEGLMRWMKWLFGAALIYAGIATIFHL